MIDCFQQILAAEGLAGFMKGLNVNIMRAIITNASELAVYDQAKSVLTSSLQWNPNSMVTHFTSSTIAGFAAAVLSSPADVVKTRFMNQTKG